MLEALHILTTPDAHLLLTRLFFRVLRQRMHWVALQSLKLTLASLLRTTRWFSTLLIRLRRWRVLQLMAVLALWVRRLPTLVWCRHFVDDQVDYSL